MMLSEYEAGSCPPPASLSDEEVLTGGTLPILKLAAIVDS